MADSDDESDAREMFGTSSSSSDEGIVVVKEVASLACIYNFKFAVPVPKVCHRSRDVQMGQVPTHRHPRPAREGHQIL